MTDIKTDRESNTLSTKVVKLDTLCCTQQDFSDNKIVIMSMGVKKRLKHTYTDVTADQYTHNVQDFQLY